MLDQVSVTVRDVARAAIFYDAIMAALGHPCVYRLDDAIGYGVRTRAQTTATRTADLRQPPHVVPPPPGATQSVIRRRRELATAAGSARRLSQIGETRRERIRGGRRVSYAGARAA
jgi:catechol 2,3-dioxygenase-like lactoylglutathione lyase family enzyme